MEDLIKEFLNGSGDGYGSGDGDGDGYGYGDGYGSGDGDGDGSGSGSGSGDGDGDGYGSGSGSGDGDGYGSGSGDGSGDGDGYGYGSGSGYGDGYGDVKHKSLYCLKKYRKGFINKQIHGLDKLNGRPVYYIDGIPCVFLSIKGNLAKVEVIKDDFTLKLQYISKAGNIFAHGDTKEQANRAVIDKFFSSMSFDQKKQEFINLFKKDELYKAQLFFEWHHHLTGSCESGRRMFVESKGIDLESNMSVLEFLELTKNEYNGEKISEVMANYS